MADLELRHLIQIGLVGVVFGTVVFGFLLDRRNLRGDVVDGAVVLRYGLGWHVFAWALLVPMAGIVSIGIWSGVKPGEAGIALLTILLLLGGPIAALVHVRGTAHELRPEGLLRVTPWARRCLLPWED